MAIFINNTPAVDPNVNYQGKTYPQDKVPLADVPVDGSVNYGGHQYPRDKVAYTSPAVDPANQPSVIKIGGLQLPPDTVIILNGEKVISKDIILDGVSVYEHIAREPYEIEFDIVIREQGAISGFNTGNTITGFNLISPFPQDAMNELWKKVWQPDSVQDLVNTYLNRLGISQIVIKRIQPATVRGSKNIPVKIVAWENIPGQSLIMNSTSVVA